MIEVLENLPPHLTFAVAMFTLAVFSLSYVLRLIMIRRTRQLSAFTSQVRSRSEYNDRWKHLERAVRLAEMEIEHSRSRPPIPLSEDLLDLLVSPEELKRLGYKPVYVNVGDRHSNQIETAAGKKLYLSLSSYGALSPDEIDLDDPETILILRTALQEYIERIERRVLKSAEQSSDNSAA